MTLFRLVEIPLCSLQLQKQVDGEWVHYCWVGTVEQQNNGWVGVPEYALEKIIGVREPELLEQARIDLESPIVAGDVPAPVMRAKVPWQARELVESIARQQGRALRAARADNERR